MPSLDDIRAHWDSRASLGETAGTQDLILKQLEQQVILAQMPKVVDTAFDVLEVGCGHGETARRIADRGYWVTATDSSPEMIAAAERYEPQQPKARYLVADVMQPPYGPDGGLFHYAYSQRCLINLPTWELQKQAIDAIADRLVSGGRFLMCEHSEEGLRAINVERYTRGLKVIAPPWHNVYINESRLQEVESLKLLKTIPFSASYYFCSRVLNAVHADAHGLEPDYDSPINVVHMSCDDRFAQGRLWVWEKI